MTKLLAAARGLAVTLLVGTFALGCRQTTCPACGAGETCITGDWFEATCLKRCHDQRDCGAGERCISFVGDTADFPFQTNPTAAVCASDGRPRFCKTDVNCDIWGFTACTDGGGFMTQSDHVPGRCGKEYAYCPTRCTERTQDCQ